ncbi:MAG: hypothetical protein J5944_08960 [Lentisphaeria bacterium]|nr:hypothetical protein [Lentisphaeria bacterium]
MDLEKDDVRNFEAAALCGNSRKVPDFGLSRDAERPAASFGRSIFPAAEAKKVRFFPKHALTNGKAMLH